MANQIDLFQSDDEDNNEILSKISDWKFEERLSKEFESIGFFMSDHPLNAFKEAFKEFNIKNYKDFTDQINIAKSNIAATILKVQERKTNKGTPYAIIKFSDLSTVFEIFIFSEILENNRSVIKEGNSLLLELTKSPVNGDESKRRTNITKISQLKDIYEKPISKIEFLINNFQQLSELKNYLNNDGETKVKIKYKTDDKIMIFSLSNKRYINRKSLKLLKKHDIYSTIT